MADTSVSAAVGKMEKLFAPSNDCDIQMGVDPILVVGVGVLEIVGHVSGGGDPPARRGVEICVSRARIDSRMPNSQIGATGRDRMIRPICRP